MEATTAVPREAVSVEDVYREQYPRLWRSLLAWCGDATIAEDAIAEAFAQALRRGDSLRDPDRWIWRSAYRIAAGLLKARAREHPGSPDVTYVLSLRDAAVAEALARLPEGQRAVVVLHYYADLPIREVARVTGSSSGAVKVSLMRARRRLRTLLEDSDG